MTYRIHKRPSLSIIYDNLYFIIIAYGDCEYFEDFPNISFNLFCIVLSGRLPEGLKFQNGKLTGKATEVGFFMIEIQVENNGNAISREFNLVVRGENMAPYAKKILASTYHTDIARRDSMWLTVPRSLYAESIEVIRDGNRLGNGSTFYSIGSDPSKEIDYYSYEWDEPQTIGLLGYHTGSMEENGGWFTSLNVEYRNEDGYWRSVEDLLIYPPIPKGEERFNRPHFVEYLLVFKPVRTTAIRMIGNAGGVKHWYSEFTRFTSITELSVHGQLSDYEILENQ